MNKDYTEDLVHKEAGSTHSVTQSMTGQSGISQSTTGQAGSSQLGTVQSVTGQSATVRKYKITIAGESYFLVSDEPEERVRGVARFVDNQMKAIAQLGHSDDLKRVAVLVAMQCASKMVAATELVEKCQAYNDKLLGSSEENGPTESI